MKGIPSKGDSKVAKCYQETDNQSSVATASSSTAIPQQATAKTLQHNELETTQTTKEEVIDPHSLPFSLEDAFRVDIQAHLLPCSVFSFPRNEWSFTSKCSHCCSLRSY